MPTRGPVPIIARSLAIFESETATTLSAPDSSTSASRLPCASNGSSGAPISSPVASESSPRTFSANCGCVLRPVPVPVTLGQEFSGYAAQIRLGRARVADALPRVAQIPLGGTATGTGLNTHPQFAEKVRGLLSDATGLAIAAPEDPFEAQGNRDALVELSGALKVIAVSLTKIANDLALMGSGPRAGIGELFLPELQKGSSIMPGKVNPVIPEVVLQVSAQVIGNDTAITVGGLQGQFELNVRIPLIARNLLQSIHLLSTTSVLFAEKCVDGIEANLEGCERSAEGTLAVATALNPFIGYDKASDIVKDASKSGRTLREVAREHGVDDATLDQALDLRKIAAGSSAG